MSILTFENIVVEMSNVDCVATIAVVGATFATALVKPMFDVFVK